MLARWWVYPVAAVIALSLLGLLLVGFAALVITPDTVDIIQLRYLLR